MSDLARQPELEEDPLEGLDQLAGLHPGLLLFLGKQRRGAPPCGTSAWWASRELLAGLVGVNSPEGDVAAALIWLMQAPEAASCRERATSLGELGKSFSSILEAWRADTAPAIFTTGGRDDG